MPRREDHEVRKGHAGHWIKKKNYLHTYIHNYIPGRVLDTNIFTLRCNQQNKHITCRHILTLYAANVSYLKRIKGWSLTCVHILQISTIGNSWGNRPFCMIVYSTGQIVWSISAKLSRFLLQIRKIWRPNNNNGTRYFVSVCYSSSSHLTKIQAIKLRIEPFQYCLKFYNCIIRSIHFLWLRLVDWNFMYRCKTLLQI